MSENLPFLEVTNDDCVSFDAFLTQHTRAIREANGIRKAGIKSFENYGIDKKAGLYVHSLVKKGGERATNHLLWILRFGLLKGILTREHIANLADMDVSVSESVKRTSMNGEAEDRGWEEGHGGIPLEDNPYPPDSEQASRWAKEWSRGTAAKQLELSFGGKAASARKELPKARRERKSVPVASPQTNGHSDVGVPVKRPRGRPRKHPLPVVPPPVESQHLSAA